MSFDQSFEQKRKKVNLFDALERVVQDVYKGNIHPYTGVDILGTIYYNCSNFECVGDYLAEYGYLNDNEEIEVPSCVNFDKVLDYLIEAMESLSRKYGIIWLPEDTDLFGRPMEDVIGFLAKTADWYVEPKKVLDVLYKLLNANSVGEIENILHEFGKSSGVHEVEKVLGDVKLMDFLVDIYNEENLKRFKKLVKDAIDYIKRRYGVE